MGPDRRTMNRFEARRVLARVRHGSSLPVVAETEGGKFLVKLRGAGHGLTALIAEIIVGVLAEALGLPVPERALVTAAPLQHGSLEV